MYRTFLGLALCCITLVSYGQNDSAQKNTFKLVRFEMNAGYGSNHLTGTAVLPFAFKSGVDSKDIENSSTFIFNRNRTGTASHIETKFEAGKHEFSLGYYSTLGASYSKNTFQLIFEGNAPFAGKKNGLESKCKAIELRKGELLLRQMEIQVKYEKTKFGL